MQAIAELTKDDPYLKLSPSERLLEYHQRRARFAARPVLDRPIALLSASERSETDSAADCLRQWDAIESPVKAFCLPSARNAREIDMPDRTPRILDIQKVVCVARGINLIEMGGDGRTAAPVMARQIAMYLAKSLTHRSTTFIGHYFGNRDHTTVLHAIRKIAKLIRSDARFAAEINALVREIAKVKT